MIRTLSKSINKGFKCTRNLSSSIAPRSSSTQASSVRNGHEFDLSAVRPTLSSFIDPSLPLTVTQFTHGQSNPTYILNSDDGRKWVLRKQPKGKLLRGAHAVDREYEIIDKLSGLIPVPKVRMFTSDTSIIGTPFYVYDYVEADFYKDCRFTNARDPTHRESMIDNMIKTAGGLHMVDYGKAGLGEYGKVGGYLKRQTKVWTSQFRATEDKDEVRMRRELSELPHVVLYDETTLLCRRFAPHLIPHPIPFLRRIASLVTAPRPLAQPLDGVSHRFSPLCPPLI